MKTPEHLGHCDGLPPARRGARGALLGAVAAMAMTGLREFTRHAGLLAEPPPETIARRLAAGRWMPLRSAQHGRRRAGAELLHWGYGAAAGAAFASLPYAWRHRRGAGPLFGLAVWTAFELAIAPALSLPQARRRRPVDRLALAADHLLYGAVLSAAPQRPTLP